MSIQITNKNALKFVSEETVNAYLPALETAADQLKNKTGAGNDFLGWVALPENYDKEEFARIKKAAEKIKSDSDALVVIGIGGSYLGARAAVEFMRSPNYNLLKKDTPNVYFVGNNLSPVHTAEILSLLEGKDFSINVISKSGTTTEPAVAFRIFKKLCEEKYGKEEAAKRIYATTDKARGALKKLADAEGYESFVIPDDVGGRYSVLTAVGLLPIAVAGVDIDEMMKGAYDEMKVLSAGGKDNPAWVYAATRNALYHAGFTTEILGCYEPAFRFMAEWWKQLYGESEGKDGKGIFPASVDLTADLHSMGQYIQDGLRNLFETVVTIETPACDRKVEADDANTDGLNYLAGMSLDAINKTASLGTVLAHVDGGVPNLGVTIPSNGAYDFGTLVYFFEYACGLSGYLLGVNPFNQPGVEAYKSNMFALLGKPGYEDKKAELDARLAK